MKKYVFIVLILLSALLLRVYRLDMVPASLFGDEIDMGYQARSLLETGRDYRGAISPFYVRSFNADRTPLPVWATMISTAIFSNPAFQVRMASVMFGVAIVFLSFLLVTNWTGSRLAGMLTALVFALSPWQIQFSRIGFEAASVGAVYLTGLVTFFKWLETKKIRWLYMATFLLSMSVYTYRTMSLFAPITFLVLASIYFKELWAVPLRDKLGQLALACILVGSFMWATTLAASDQLRIGQISIFSDPETPIWVQRSREIDSGDLTDSTVGKSAVWWSKIFHNKIASWYVAGKNNYFEAFSSQFLFLSGDPNLRHSTGKGMVLTIDILGLIAGGYWILSKQKNRHYRWLLVWLLLAPLPSAITKDGGGGHHASRLFIMSLPLLIIIGLGWWRIVLKVFSQKWGVLVAAALLIGYLTNFGFYYHDYQTHYRLESAKFFGYGYRPALELIEQEVKKGGYQSVWITESLDPPLPQVWFWNKVLPAKVQELGTRYGGSVNGANIYAVNWPERLDESGSWEEAIETGNLYLLANQDLPKDWKQGQTVPEGVRLIATFKYPDNVPVFYLITRDELD